MADIKIDERKILEWAGFTKLIPQEMALSGKIWWKWRMPNGQRAVAPSTLSLDFQAKYLWPHLKKSYELGYNGEMFYFNIFQDKDFIVWQGLSNIAAEACLLAIQEMLDGKDRAIL
jgi:hypothetical protein